MTQTEYLQNDLGCSSYLATIGYELIGLERLREGFHAFKFRDPIGNAERDSKAYFAGAPVNAEKLLRNLRILKSMLRGAKYENTQGVAKNGTYRRTR